MDNILCGPVKDVPLAELEEAFLFALAVQAQQVHDLRGVDHEDPAEELADPLPGVQDDLPVLSAHQHPLVQRGRQPQEHRRFLLNVGRLHQLFLVWYNILKTLPAGKRRQANGRP